MICTALSYVEEKMQVLAGAPHAGAALLRRRSGAAKGRGELRRADPFRPSIGIAERWRRLSAAGAKKMHESQVRDPNRSPAQRVRSRDESRQNE